MNSGSVMKQIQSYFLHILFLLITLIWVYPMIWAITSSLKSNHDLYNSSLSPLPSDFHWSSLLPANWGTLGTVLHFENYARAWYVASFATYFYNTVVFSVAVVVIVVLLCCMTGYVLGRYSFPGKVLFISAFTATMFIPHGYTIIPIWQIINLLGLNHSLGGIILAEAGGTHVLYILLFMAYFAGIPKELEEASELDGAGFIRIFTTVMLPLSKPVIATSAILQFIGSWNSFFVPLVFSLNRPDLRTLGVGMLSFINEKSSDLVGMAAGATISLVPIILVFIFFQKYFVEGIAGAVKG